MVAKHCITISINSKKYPNLHKTIEDLRKKGANVSELMCDGFLKEIVLRNGSKA
jgi:hypothetical protein